MPFEEFVEAVASIPDLYADRHFASQYSFITDKDGKLLVNFMGKFENFQEDLSLIFEKLGISETPELPHLNQTNRKSYKDYYTNRAKNLIRERYAKDIETFEYDF